MVRPTYTEEQVLDRFRELLRTGKPEKAYPLQEKFYAGEEITPEEMGDAPAPDPDAPSAPPKAGKGSGADAWKEFAVAKGVDAEVVEAMSRDEIVEMMEDGGYA